MAMLLNQHRMQSEAGEGRVWEWIQRSRSFAEVGPTATDISFREWLSPLGWCLPGDDESAAWNYSHRSPKGNRHMRPRSQPNGQTPQPGPKEASSEIVYRRSVPRLGHNQAIGAIAHRQCRLIWLILHQGVRYEEGAAVTKQSKQRRTARMIRQLEPLAIGSNYKYSALQSSTGAVIFDPVVRLISRGVTH